MNTEDVGTPVALITFEGDKKKNKTLSIENDKANVADYLKHIKLTKPKEKIQYISSINEDSSIDKVKNMKRIRLTNELLMTDLKADDFKDSLVIFDDTDCLTNKTMRMKVNGILNMLLETGRHTNTSVIYTSHLATNGLETRRILNEAHSITIFPHSLGGRSLKYLLENYFGLDKHQIKKIKTLPSRWVTLVKSFPMVVLSEKEAFVLNLPDEE